MKKWVAYTGKDNRITSVGARNEHEARKRVREALDRPGRYGFLKAWQEDGEKVREETTG